MEGLSERGGRRSGAGRPKGIKVPYSALSLPKEDIEALRKLAHRIRWTLSFLIRKLIESYTKGEEVN